MRGIRRREFISLLGGTAFAWPLAEHGQQAGKVIRIGFIGASLRDRGFYFAGTFETSSLAICVSEKPCAT
jgi:hypothetical protein